MSSLTASSSMLLRRMISSTSISGRRFFRRTTTTEIASTTALLASPIKLHTEFLAATKNTITANTDDKELGNDNNNNKNEYTILFLHGLLGNGRNLKTFARNVVKQQQSSGILMDIRGHGKSYQTQKQDNDNDTYDTISTFQDCTQDIIKIPSKQQHRLVL
jgi:predicted alpha/beta-fold hydrolase